ncbi:MAG: hypothetical protein ACK5OC_17805 [Pirellula sp.]
MQMRWNMQVASRWIALSLLIILAGCDEQMGRFIVTQRTSHLVGTAGRIDFIWGNGTEKASSTDELLLVFVSYAEGRQFTEILEKSGDGRTVSTLNLTFNSAMAPSFGFGSIWNRENDQVGIDSQSFVRARGRVFFIFSDKLHTKSVKQVDFEFEGDSITQIEDFVVSRIAQVHARDVSESLQQELVDFRKNK